MNQMTIARGDISIPSRTGKRQGKRENEREGEKGSDSVVSERQRLTRFLDFSSDSGSGSVGAAGFLLISSFMACI